MYRRKIHIIFEVMVYFIGLVLLKFIFRAVISISFLIVICVLLINLCITQYQKSKIVC